MIMPRSRCVNDALKKGRKCQGLWKAHLSDEMIPRELERVGQRLRGGELDRCVGLVLVHALRNGVENGGRL